MRRGDLTAIFLDDFWRAILSHGAAALCAARGSARAVHLRTDCARGVENSSQLVQCALRALQSAEKRRARIPAPPHPGPRSHAPPGDARTHPLATSHFSHDALLRDLKTLDGQDRRTAAVLLSRVAEFEERRLFLREGYP